MIDSKFFKMKGEYIWTAAQFGRCFSPEDLLRNREIAAIFAANRLSPLSSWHTFHSTVLMYAALDWELLEGQVDSTDKTCYQYYFSCRDAKTHANIGEAGVRIDKDQIFTWIQERKDIVEKLWAIAMKAPGLEDPEKRQLFFLLTAGYMLANRSPDEAGFSITPAQAAAAFRRESTPENWEPREVGIQLQYKVGRVYDLKPAPPMYQGGRIRIARITAVPGPGGDTDSEAVIRLGSQEKHLKSGHYVYASFLEDGAVRFYPRKKENGAWSLFRSGGRLIRFDGTNKESICQDEGNIVDFAISSEGKCILLWADPRTVTRVDLTGFSGVRMPSGRIVEVDFRENDAVFMLDYAGQVYRDGEAYTPARPKTFFERFINRQTNVLATLDHLPPKEEEAK